MLCDRSSDRLHDPPRSVAREPEPFPIVKFLDRPNQAAVPLRDQILERETTTLEVRRDLDHQPQIRLDHVAPGDSALVHRLLKLCLFPRLVRSALESGGGLFAFDLWGYTAYTYSLMALFLVFLVVRRIIHSPFGLSLRGIRENWTRMPAVGAPSLSHLRKVYTISAAIAGLAGALLAQTTETVSLQVLSFERSADTLVMLVLGGTGRLYGGIIGAIIFMVARDQFSGINPQLWYFWIGLLLVAVVMLLPNGVLGGLAQLTQRFRGGRS